MPLKFPASAALICSKNSLSFGISILASAASAYSLAWSFVAPDSHVEMYLRAAVINKLEADQNFGSRLRIQENFSQIFDGFYRVCRVYIVSARVGRIVVEDDGIRAFFGVFVDRVQKEIHEF